MTTTRNKNLIVNYVFILGILTLFLNDQFFKYQYSNFLTGKLSDIFGIIIFPMLLTFSFPKLKENSIFAAAGIFIFWKSEYSQSLINFYNKYSFIETSRIIDYYDLFVLLLLPIPYFLIKNIDQLEKIHLKKINPKFIFIPSIFVLVAESPPPSFYYTMNKGNLKCYNCKMTIDKSQQFVLSNLKQNGIEFDSIMPILYRSGIDSLSGGKRYLKKELIIDDDTLKNISFTIFPIKENKTKIYFTGMDVSEKLSRNPKIEKELRKHYKKMIFNRIKQNLR